jgi:hypothetical protein
MRIVILFINIAMPVRHHEADCRKRPKVKNRDTSYDVRDICTTLFQLLDVCFRVISVRLFDLKRNNLVITANGTRKENINSKYILIAPPELVDPHGTMCIAKSATLLSMRGFASSFKFD